MSKFEEITNGWLNLLLDKEKELAESRAKICSNCEIYSNGFCSSSKCIEGKGCGCGCPIKAKIRSVKTTCPIGEW